ncbi:hypothetical protein M407DRAFT_23969 [Tulasnella calospora MUT 4182]|uniref:Homeobox domain-containing protein n=1 Tax=Tulasnella calospora MUT 4182 TaxID=1051891 RepID=A0A0C3QK98_9AGAM|nr:hypothetical protein M407DRAFT_23969 [Tulasnella calospora MUT 4182]
MDPHPEYVNDLREHVQHTRDHSLGLDCDLWGPSSLPHTVLPPATIWSPEEKHQFFRALSRHSRLRPDLIAQDIGGSKSVTEVCVYLDALERAAKSLPEGSEPLHFQIAIEVPATIVRFEDKQSRILKKLETNENLLVDSNDEEDSNSSSTSEDEDSAIDGPSPRKKRRIERKERSRSASTSAGLSERKRRPGHEKRGTSAGALGEAVDDSGDDVLNRLNVVRLARFYFHNVRTPKGKLQRLGFTEKSISEDIFSELKKALAIWLQGFIRTLVLLLESDLALLQEDTRIVMARDIKSLLAASRQPRNKKQFFSDLPRRLDLPGHMEHAGTPEEDETSEDDDRSSSAISSDHEGDNSLLPNSAHIWHSAIIKSVERPPRRLSPSEMETTDEDDRDQTSGSESEELLGDVDEQLIQSAALNQREVYDLKRRYFGTSPEAPLSELGTTRTNSARYSAQQIAVLEEVFATTAFPDAPELIAERCGLSRNQVKEWFKYQRRKRGIHRYEIERQTPKRSQWNSDSGDDIDRDPPAYRRGGRATLSRRAKDTVQGYF